MSVNHNPYFRNSSSNEFELQNMVSASNPSVLSTICKKIEGHSSGETSESTVYYDPKSWDSRSIAFEYQPHSFYVSFDKDGNPVKVLESIYTKFRKNVGFQNQRMIAPTPKAVFHHHGWDLKTVREDHNPKNYVLLDRDLKQLITRGLVDQTTTTTTPAKPVSIPLVNNHSPDTTTTTTTQSSSPTTDESEQNKTSSSSSIDESSPFKAQYPELWVLFEEMIAKEAQVTALLGRNSAITTWGNSYQSQNLTLDGDHFACLNKILAYTTEHNISSEEAEKVELAVREERNDLINACY